MLQLNLNDISPDIFDTFCANCFCVKHDTHQDTACTSDVLEISLLTNYKTLQELTK